ncbi:hypothetical protein OS493_024272 [Desmophyllum pertusum]|uniref:Uncharacterized protein n=1 Tax=Desmophyllum pertusum TaxID=174260 RepID=A0A9W9YY32_9CNID|nr:hypothetical protein OS493_024272 [Desmophyllum pertusum]
MSSFRTGVQCKACLKYLQDEYKRVKDHNYHSGNNCETFEYFDEMDEVLGCRPNIMPKSVVECGLDDNITTTRDSNSPQPSGSQDQDSDKELEEEFEKNLKGNPNGQESQPKEKCLPQRKQRPCHLRQMSL